MLDKKEEQILKKFKRQLWFDVSPTDSNPQMNDDSPMKHFEVEVTNRFTRYGKVFIMSFGIGHNDLNDDKVIFGLLSSLYMDMPYIDLDEFDGLGYEGKEAVNKYNAICEQYEKMKILGMHIIFDGLSEEEKELLN